MARKERATPTGTEGQALRRRIAALEAENAGLRAALGSAGDQAGLQAPEILESIGDAFYALDRELRFTYANRHALRFWGRTQLELLGRPMLDAFPQGKDSDVHRAAVGVLRTGLPAHLETFSPVLHRWLAFSLHPATGGVTVYFRDVSTQRQIEERLRESEQRLRATQEHAGLGIGEVDREGRFLRVNEALCAITGYSREDLLARTIFDLTQADDRPPEEERYARQQAGGLDSYTVEKRFLHRDGSVRWASVAGSSVRDGGGSFLYGVRVVQDVTDRKLAEARQRLLLHELNHRVKNTLAVVQSIGTRSLSEGRSLADARQAFTQRLRALAQAHTLLTEASWRGAGLRALVEGELQPFGGRARLSGEQVILGPKATLTFSMIVHELATNAAKYGALSAPGGSIAVAWETARAEAGPVLRFTWSEQGGPEVAAAAGQGFGRTLVEEIAAYDLGGTAALDLLQEGARYRLEAPLDRVLADDAAP